MNLFTVNNRKTLKGAKKGYLTLILHLAPHKLSGRNVCPFASAGCIKACLNTSGFGRYSNVQEARVRRTQLFWDNRAAFLYLLSEEIRTYERRAAKKGLKLAVRLNGTSDLPWENWGLMEQFPGIAFYDYLKSPIRAQAYLDGKMPPNYHLTFSRSESNGLMAQSLAAKGMNIAVVFKSLPVRFMGKPVFNGDDTDLRFLDPMGVIVGLTAKGRAKWDKSGFVVSDNAGAHGRAA